jgi:hypothetical protein
VTKSSSTLWLKSSLAGLGLAIAAVGSTGCQITEGGQTLPSPYYQHDDIQYFAPGPEFKLQREASAMKAYKAELDMQQRAQ